MVVCTKIGSISKKWRIGDFYDFWIHITVIKRKINKIYKIKINKLKWHVSIIIIIIIDVKLKIMIYVYKQHGQYYTWSGRLYLGLGPPKHSEPPPPETFTCGQPRYCARSILMLPSLPYDPRALLISTLSQSNLSITAQYVDTCHHSKGVQ